MRFKLYELKIEWTNGWSTSYVVAPGEQRAAELVVDHDMELRQEHLQFTLERVDDVLPDDRRKGLADMLGQASVGLSHLS